MTHQDIFDKVVAHLFTQGRPAKDKFGNCAYRGQNNTSCAVGCLIPDEKYKNEMEGKAVSFLAIENRDEFAVLFPSIRMSFLQSLQKAHDSCATNPDGTFETKSLKMLLSDVAKDYSLSEKVLESY